MLDPIVTIPWGLRTRQNKAKLEDAPARYENLVRPHQ